MKQLLARLVMWIWKKSGHFLATAYEWLVRNGNRLRR
jgi:hypothetical protein